MSYTRKLTTTWTDGSTPLTKQTTLTGDSVDGRFVDVPNGTVAHVIDLTFEKAKLVGIVVKTDRAVTMFTNHITGSGDEFELSPDALFAWCAESGVPNPFTQDVTGGFYFENPVSTDGAAAAIQIEIEFNQ